MKKQSRADILQVLQTLGALSARVPQILKILDLAWGMNKISKKSEPLLVHESARITVAAAYYHFGFPCLGLLGREGLANRLHVWMGIDEDVTKNWLCLAAELILQGAFQDESICGHYDWDELDSVYAHGVVSRCLSAELCEFERIGLFAVGEKELSSIHDLGACALSQMLQGINSVSDFANLIHSSQVSPPFLSALEVCLSEVSKNTLTLLFWRTAAYSRLGPTDEGIFLSIRNDEKLMEPKIRLLCSIIIVLSPLESGSGVRILPDSPLSVPRIASLIERFQLDRTFELSMQNTAALHDALSLGVTSGLLFQVNARRNRQEYGLTVRGLHVSSPFLGMLAGIIDDEERCDGEKKSLSSKKTPDGTQTSPEV